MMFWSKTKVVVHGFTEKRKDCFVTLEDTVLGYALNGLTWCGKKGSNGNTLKAVDKNHSLLFKRYKNLDTGKRALTVVYINHARI